jgi:hypothetical protein
MQSKVMYWIKRLLVRHGVPDDLPDVIYRDAILGLLFLAPSFMCIISISAQEFGGWFWVSAVSAGLLLLLADNWVFLLAFASFVITIRVGFYAIFVASTRGILAAVAGAIITIALGAIANRRFEDTVRSAR